MLQADSQSQNHRKKKGSARCLQLLRTGKFLQHLHHKKLHCKTLPNSCSCKLYGCTDHQGVVASSANVRPLRAQNTAECIVTCLATCGSLLQGPHNKQSQLRPRLEGLKLVSHKTAAVHQPSKVSWTQLLLQLLQLNLQ